MLKSKYSDKIKKSNNILPCSVENGDWTNQRTVSIVKNRRIELWKGRKSAQKGDGKTGSNSWSGDITGMFVLYSQLAISFGP